MITMVATNTKTEIRRVVGTGKFTSQDFAQGAQVSSNAARVRLDRLVAQGLVEKLDETQPVTDEEGTPVRGRPRQVYRVRKGRN
jgi:predicted ArsR family transcriptional regulator